MRYSGCRVTVVMSALLIEILGAAGLAPGKLQVQPEKVTVVSNSRKPVKIPGGPDFLILQEELTIGRGADDSSRFSQLLSVQADSEGCIYALDGKDCLIKAFDPEGRFLRTIGKRGQGPGEFSAPSRIIVTSNDDIAALDDGNRRLSFFKRDGTLIKELSTAKWIFVRFRLSSRGDIYADHAARSDQGVIVMQLSKFSPDLASSTVLATEPRPTTPNRYDAFPLWFQHGITHDDGLVWAVNSRYEITVLDADGKTRMKILKVPEPNPLRDDDRKAKLEGDYRGIPPDSVDFPSQFPPIWTLVVADTDHIFVRTYVKDKQGGALHDVFDPAGRFVAQFTLGEEEFAMVARNGKLYTLVREDAEGVPLVKRYGMIWK